ncbi:MAG: hypothetical protein H7Y00_02105 [Fimbriimonadaceae bacterium]|nr:hypothetical protein [Chitinophagales bacterium]
MPFQKCIAFNNVSEITFHPSASEVLIKVNGVDLGTINLNYAVTVYIANTPSGKKIWMKEISDQSYRENNNNDPQRTVTFDQTNRNANLHVEKCDSNNTYKIYGWDDEDTTISCTGGNGYNTWFTINNECNFKSKMESVEISGQQVHRLIVRYGQNTKYTCPSNAACCANLFCYVCC